MCVMNICGLRQNFGIRSVFTVVTIAAVCCVFLGNSLRSSLRQDHQAQLLRSQGIRVIALRPKTLTRALLGDAFCLEQIIIEIDDTPFEHSNKEQYLPRNESTITQIDKQTALRILGDLDGLVEMRLLSRHIDDSWTKVFSNARDLRRVFIEGTGITEVGLNEVFQLDQLMSLAISSDFLTDDLLESVVNLRQLNRLNLLGSNKVTSDGLNALVDLEHLESLVVGKGVDDASVDAIAKVQNVKEVVVPPDSLSSTGIRKLEELRPDITVIGPYSNEYSPTPFGEQ